MPSVNIKHAFNQAVAIIKKSRLGVALTGAGISTPSGIPDFRSEGTGLWNHYNPENVISLSAFRYRPETFFSWLRPIARDIIKAEPNPAHIALAKLEIFGYLKNIITQNIDGLLQRAGAKQVLEVHGTLRTLTCIRCYKNFNSENGFINSFVMQGIMPRCPNCDGILKPDVILYEEQLPIQVWSKAEIACKKTDTIIIAGSSLEVMPVAGLPIRALENGAFLIIINKSSTYLDSRADVILKGDVAQILPDIVAEVILE